MGVGQPAVHLNPPDRHRAFTTARETQESAGISDATMTRSLSAKARPIPAESPAGRRCPPGHAAALTRLAARSVQRTAKRPRVPVHSRPATLPFPTTVIQPAEH